MSHGGAESRQEPIARRPVGCPAEPVNRLDQGVECQRHQAADVLGISLTNRVPEVLDIGRHGGHDPALGLHGRGVAPIRRCPVGPLALRHLLVAWRTQGLALVRRFVTGHATGADPRSTSGTEACLCGNALAATETVQDAHEFPCRTKAAGTCRGSLPGALYPRAPWA